jgi:RNA polymerase sigma-70 factor (ECF subfamily)
VNVLTTRLGALMDWQEKENDEKFISIYRAYVDEIYRYVFLRTGMDMALAEDITQNIFLEVFRGIKRFKGLCSKRTWIFKIARNKVYDYYRRQYRQTVDFVSLESESFNELRDPGQEPEKFVEMDFESRQIENCLNKLPENYRITLLLKYVEGKNVKEIAKIADKSVKSIESTLQRAKASFIKLYKKIQMEGSYDGEQ